MTRKQKAEPVATTASDVSGTPTIIAGPAEGRIGRSLDRSMGIPPRVPQIWKDFLNLARSIDGKGPTPSLVVFKGGPFHGSVEALPSSIVGENAPEARVRLHRSR